MSTTTPQQQPGHYEREPLLHHQEHASASTFSSSATIVDISAGSDRLAVKVPVDRLAHHRDMVRERFSFNWWLEWIVIIFVFSITGSSTMMIVRPLLKVLGFTGSWGAGPWSFRLAYLGLTLPLYSCMLLLISSLFCRRSYFENILIKMWGRLLPSRLTRRCVGDRTESAP
ncbi:hypothetical protein BGZ83_011238 [Gryganskiella cystojenkinii]|nr:hypothetical protein BGZ83_011238 [Gryganskiella cystojenkinii]